MVLSDPPAITMHTIYECEPDLHRSAILEFEGINTGVDCKLTKSAYVGFINGSYRILLKKVGKIIFGFFVIVTDPVGHYRHTGSLPVQDPWFAVHCFTHHRGQ